MASSLLILLAIVGGSISSLILVYGAYWAFQIRRALFVSTYRNQALWIGFFSLYFVAYALGADTFG